MSLQILYTLSFVVEINGPEDYGLPATTSPEDFSRQLRDWHKSGVAMIEDTIDSRNAMLDTLMVSVIKKD